MARRKFLCPNYRELIEPVFTVLIELGGSGSNEEIYEAIIEKLNLPDNIVDEMHDGTRTELEYQLAWARTYLKNYGAITNSARRIWMITADFSTYKEIDAKQVIKTFTKNSKLSENNSRTSSSPRNDSIQSDEDIKVAENSIPEELEPWRIELSNILHNMNPYAFECLAMLLLRECGFSEVNVTKKSGDGGIDGTGKLRINGIFSFNVAFQCKRYSGSVSAPEIRDFRGSLTTDIEKGVFITTGTYTREAKKEAARAGSKQIDLMDGEEFINKLIEYHIGVKEKTIYEVDREYFDKIKPIN